MMRILWMIVAALLLSGGMAEAATCAAVPNTFVNGQIADANQVNANFTANTNCGTTALQRWTAPTSAGAPNAQTVTFPVAPNAYAVGDSYIFLVGGGLTNTGSATLNVNGLGAKTVQRGGQPLVGGEMMAGQAVSVVYDGNQFQIAPNVSISKSVTGTYASTVGDCNLTLVLGGSAFYTTTLPAASTMPAPCTVTLVNQDTARAKTLAITGWSNGGGDGLPTNEAFLWPGQTAHITNQSNVWIVDRPARWKFYSDTSTPLKIYTDFTNGSDTNDGLAAGTGNAMKTAQWALERVCSDFDLASNPQGQVIVQMAAGESDTTPVHFPCPGVPGRQGGVSITLQGADATATLASTTDDALSVYASILTVKNLTISATGSFNCLVAGFGATVFAQGQINYAGCGGANRLVQQNASLADTSTSTISATMTNDILIEAGGWCQCNSARSLSASLTLNTNGPWLREFAGGNGDFSGETYTLNGHTVTGKKFWVDLPAGFLTGVSDPSVLFPGSVVGTGSQWGADSNGNVTTNFEQGWVASFDNDGALSFGVDNVTHNTTINSAHAMVLGPVGGAALFIGNTGITPDLTLNSTAGSSTIIGPAGGAHTLTITPSVVQITSTVAFSSLPSCAGGTEGSMAPISDSTTATWGATITGGSTNHVLAYCDGSNWTVMAK